MTKQALVTAQTVLDGGEVEAGALLEILESGTSTPVIVYSDAGLTTPHANPIVADGDGVFPAVFYGGAVELKAVVKTSAGATIYTINPVPLVGSTGSSAIDIAFSPVTGNASANVQEAIAANTTRHESRSTNVKTLLLSANNAEMRTNLGLGTAAVMNDSTSTDLTVDPDNVARRDIVKSYVDAEVASATAAPQVLAAVTFNGSTQAIASQYNVSSVTRTTAGRFEINFTASLSTSAYFIVATDESPQTAIGVSAVSVDQCTVAINTTVSSASGVVDSTKVNVVVIG